MAAGLPLALGRRDGAKNRSNPSPNPIWRLSGADARGSVKIHMTPVITIMPVSLLFHPHYSYSVCSSNQLVVAVIGDKELLIPCRCRVTTDAPNTAPPGLHVILRPIRC